MFASNDFTQPSFVFLIRLYSVFEMEDSFRVVLTPLVQQQKSILFWGGGLSGFFGCFFCLGFFCVLSFLLFLILILGVFIYMYFESMLDSPFSYLPVTVA